MQNILLWVKSSKGGFKFRYNKNTDLIDNYIKLQIENSLRLGWKKEDIVLSTNFDFEYMGVKTNKIDDICEWSSFANKLVMVDTLIKRNIINDDFWLHDLDAFQLQKLEFPKDCKDVGFTKHAPGRTKPQGGSSFYRKQAYDIVETISNMIKKFKATKEESFFPYFYNRICAESLLKKYETILGKIKQDNPKYQIMLERRNCVKKYFGNFEDRFSWLDWTYNLFRVKHFSHKYKVAQKPIKIVHFHPEYESTLDCFYHGKNAYKVKIVTPELAKLLIKYKLVKE